MEFEELPDGWEEVEYETGPSRGDGRYDDELDATWAAEDEHVVVQSTQSVDASGVVTYPITVEQHVERDGLSTVIQTHARVADGREEAEEMAVQFMEEVNDGQHVFRVMGVQVPDEMDFVQFYTLSDSELPGTMTADQMIDIIEGDEEANDIDDLPDEITRDVADEQMIQVDVFPRHKEEVDGFNDTQ